MVERSFGAKRTLRRGVHEKEALLPLFSHWGTGVDVRFLNPHLFGIAACGAVHAKYGPLCLLNDLDVVSGAFRKARHYISSQRSLYRDGTLPCRNSRPSRGKLPSPTQKSYAPMRAQSN